MSDSDNAKICRVGYALNAKKLRRAASVATAGEQPAPQQQQSSRLGSPWRGGGLADILELEPSAGELVQFIPWDHETPLECQPEFHVIIHKLTEDIDRVESSSKLQALEQYISQHPSTVIVDPIASVRKVVSRARTCFHLQSIENRLGNQCPFHQPNFLLVGQCSDDELLAEVRAKNMSFPLICKPIEACGTPHSHQMVVVLSAKDVGMIPRNCIVQQYHDHGGYFFKVYVINGRVCAYIRPSLPNLRSKASSCHSIAFDSRYCYPTLETFVTPAASPLRRDKLWQPQNGSASSSLPSLTSPSWPSSSIAHPSSLSSSPPPPPLPLPTATVAPPPAVSPYATRDASPLHFPPLASLAGENEDVCTSSSAAFDCLRMQLQQTANALQEEFALSLFGFDVILPLVQDDVDRRPMVIDVNYFPSYKEVADFPSRLRKYLRSLAFPEEAVGSVPR